MLNDQRQATKASLILVIGGASSGKSSFALSLAGSLNPKAFVATAEPRDAEIAQRIERHRQSRGEGWDTVEEPLAPATWLARHGRDYEVVLLDCLTLWLSNLVGQHKSTPQIFEEVTTLLCTIRDTSSKVIIVTNELGMSLVPMEAAARQFRQLSGEINQMVSAQADEVYAVMAGIPAKLKSAAREHKGIGKI
jgi:adenosylcobinamide kinase/adenosylcobinamide-phosphate guanylyltransferase